MNVLNIGVFAEGATDYRFWIPMIEKIFTKIAFDAHGLIDIFVDEIKISKIGKTFEDQVLAASSEALNKGMRILVVHKDADSINNNDTYQNNINPAFESHNLHKNPKVEKLVALVPIQETESWLIADKSLFKEQLGTKKTDVDLGIHRNPEQIANPKEVLENAINIVNMDKSPKRRNLNLTDLYQSIGSELELQHLERFNSYQDLEENIRQAFIYFNLIH